MCLWNTFIGNVSIEHEKLFFFHKRRNFDKRNFSHVIKAPNLLTLS